MSWNWNSHGLPFLPGYNFRDITKSAFPRSQTLYYKNGYAVQRRPTVIPTGQDPLLSAELNHEELSRLAAETLDFIYGTSEKNLVEDFIPAYVALDKKVLRFYAYFQEDILYSPEMYRVRPVVIYFYLEDNSMCIIEPKVENSGIPQGKRMKRQRLPKKENGKYYQWKDLNLGMDLEVYGVKYHIAQCDAFTKNFMESEGVVVNDPEPMPEDPYIKHRKKPVSYFTTPSEFDCMYQFLAMDRKVLRFFALWDDTDRLYGDCKAVKIQYYLVDDTVEVREVHEPNSGRDPFPILMRRQRLAKKLKPGTFASCVLEVTKNEVDEYYSPKDFQLGQMVTLLGRRFLLYDCDSFTREYFQRKHPDIEMKATEAPKVKTLRVKNQKAIPPYNGFGSPEDSLQNCFSLIPKRPKKDVQKMLVNDHNVLRYSARLDSLHPEDEGRCFVLSYLLSSDMISIYEKPTHNSGITGGKFLQKSRVPKPNSTVENPQFYSPADLAIGATVEVFGHRFILTDADHYVLKYLEANSSQIPSHTLNSLRQKLGAEKANNQTGDQKNY